MSRRRAFLKLEALEGRCVPSTVTNLNDSGPGSLRYAIAITPAGGTVDFQPGLTGTITLTTAGLPIFKNLTIIGPGADKLTIDGDDVWRVFDIKPATNTALIGVTIANGAAVDGGGVRNAGTLSIRECVIQLNHAFETGGGVHNNGTLYLTTSTVYSNSSLETGGGIYNYGFLALNDSSLSANGATDYGGGIYNNGGIVTISNSTLNGNQAPEGQGGAIDNVYGNVTITGSTLSNNSVGTGSGGGGGAIYNYGAVVVTASILSGNSGEQGGGITNNGGSLVVSDSSFVDNRASGCGAIFNIAGRATITGSTLSGNQAGFLPVGVVGGALCNVLGTTTIENSTIANNSAGPANLNSAGGGIYNQDGRVRLKNSTISRNTATSGGGIYNSGGKPVTVRDVIIAKNIATYSKDVNGALFSKGHNLIGDGTGGSGYAPTDLVGTSSNPIDPKLGPLQDNGGPTFTMALLPGSPATNAGDNTDAPAWDQRGPGFPRIVNGTIDIGAFEVQASGVSVPGSRTPFGNPIVETPFRFELGMSVSASARRETEFRGDAFPNGVRERVLSGIVIAEVRKKANNGVAFPLTLHAADSNMFDPSDAPYF